MTHPIKWLALPEEHDYPAALSYLTLHFNEEIAASLVDRLRAAPVCTSPQKTSCVLQVFTRSMRRIGT